MNTKMLLGLIFLASLAITGCKNDTPSSSPIGSGSASGSPTSPGSSGEEQTTQAVRIGSFNAGGNFIAGVVGRSESSLQAGESTSLQVVVVNESNVPSSRTFSVQFTSPCISNGLSEVEPAVRLTSGGSASTTYTARGCDSNDQITAIALEAEEGAGESIVITGSTTLSATTTIQTQPAPLGALGFVGASEPRIGIQGTGVLSQQSVVTFKLTNTSGGPVPNHPVDFSLNTTVGGISLSNSSNRTDSNGIVSTTVTSGTVATSVRVTATASHDGRTTTAQSSMLAITTGIPSQRNFSLSAETLNIEGLNWDGIQTEITIRAADRFNNPVADGTAVNFTSQGGSIEGHCLTENGFCSVTLTSQEHKPPNGRVTVMAHAIGEEDFADLNGNGRFDDEEFNEFLARGFDLPEAFRDDDETGSHTQGEFFIDFDGSGSYSGPNERFDGLLCNGPNLCGSNTTTVFRNMAIVFAGSSLNVEVLPGNIDLSGGPQIITVTVSDINGHPPPAGSEIAVTTTHGEVAAPTTRTQASTNSPDPAVYLFEIRPTAEGSGNLTVTVTTPQGIISRSNPIPVIQQ